MREDDIKTVRERIYQCLVLGGHSKPIKVWLDEAYEAVKRLTAPVSSEAVQRAIEWMPSDEEHDNAVVLCWFNNHKETILSALRAYAPVDIESLKVDRVTGMMHPDDPAVSYQSACDTGWNECLDHLKSEGIL